MSPNKCVAVTMLSLASLALLAAPRAFASDSTIYAKVMASETGFQKDATSIERAARHWRRSRDSRALRVALGILDRHLRDFSNLIYAEPHSTLLGAQGKKLELRAVARERRSITSIQTALNWAKFGSARGFKRAIARAERYERMADSDDRRAKRKLRLAASMDPQRDETGQPPPPQPPARQPQPGPLDGILNQL
jgi:hypothetical protein